MNGVNETTWGHEGKTRNKGHITNPKRQDWRSSVSAQLKNHLLEWDGGDEVSADF
jgi:hypothetical protein